MGRMTERRPNVLFIICDQLRHDHLGFAGNGIVRTPRDTFEHRGQRRDVGAAAAARSLRCAGGTRGEQHDATRLGRTLCAVTPVCLDQSVQGISACHIRIEVLDPRPHHRQAGEPLHGRAQESVELVVGDEHVDVLALEHVGELWCGETGIEQHRVGAESRHRGDRLDEAAMIAAHDRDGRRARHGGQRRGQGVGPPVQFTPGDRSGLIDDRDAVRVAGGCQADAADR